MGILSLFVFHGWHSHSPVQSETVPNTKLVNNSYVSSPDGLLQESTVNQINNQLRAVGCYIYIVIRVEFFMVKFALLKRFWWKLARWGFQWRWLSSRW